MSGKAKSKYIRMSARKIGMVLDKIRGKNVGEAYKILMTINRRAVGPVKKTLDAAVSNGDAKEMLDKIIVKTAWVGVGPALKRLRPRAMGRADVYKRHTAHIRIEVE
ncbi:MAG: 50S ribosomal protein L22 [Elusimicrobia bacterium]|nr:50S ribosomal protein L22 [Elusimicrobiota bacterium]